MPRRFERMRGRDGNVVEQAEAHRLVARGVVPGRADEAEGGIEVAVAAPPPWPRATPPAARSAASYERATAYVSASNAAPGDAGGRGDLFDQVSVWTRRRSSSRRRAAGCGPLS